MDNPETLATYVTQDTGRRQTKQKHNTTNTANLSHLGPLGFLSHKDMFLVIWLFTLYLQFTAITGPIPLLVDY